MIERYSLTASSQQISERFSADVPGYYTPRFNAAPTQLLPVITSSDPNGLSVFYWGRPPLWAKNKPLSEKIVNLHVESMERPVFKKALQKFRCIIPADGFYAWKKLGKKTSIPYRFVTDSGLFSFAGLWEEFEDETGSMAHTFTLITRESDETVGKITERMPVIFGKNEERIWLSPASAESSLLALLKAPVKQKFNLYTVSPRINEIKLDVPSLIRPAPPADQYGNLTLFD